MDEVLETIIGMLVEVTGGELQSAPRITPSTRLEADLQLESVEFAAFVERARVVFGDSVDLSEYVRDLTIDDIIALTVGHVVEYVTARTRPEAGVAR